MGNIIQNNKEKNVVLVKDNKTGKVQALKVGNTILGHKILEIRQKALLLEQGKTKTLVFQDKFANEVKKGFPQARPKLVSLPPQEYDSDTYSEPGFERKKGQIIMSRGYRDQLINHDLGKILMQATAEPFFQGGRISGFKLTQIDQDSIFSKGGFQNEDIVTAINGKSLANIATAIQILKSLKGMDQIEIEILRGGQAQTITLSVQ